MKFSSLPFVLTLLGSLAWAFPTAENDAVAVKDGESFSPLTKRQGQCLTRPNRPSVFPQTITIDFRKPQNSVIAGVRIEPSKIRLGRYKIRFTTQASNVRDKVVFFFPPGGATTTTGQPLDVPSLATSCLSTEITYDFNRGEPDFQSFDVWILNTRQP
ncbi:hypothetical protein M3J07_004836 [Ascochyta lentis]